MMRHFNLRRSFLFIVIILAGGLIAACAPTLRPVQSELDTPAHHVVTGMKLFEQGTLGEAQREFDLALQLDPKFSQAYTGTALVKAYRGDYDGAMEALDKAKGYGKAKEDKLAAD
ncbi:MAG: hypothetical protein PHY31_03045, partial [Smithellaceae bacterium]|nr:hypothetical protein [Smithellaceae bacterium]